MRGTRPAPPDEGEDLVYASFIAAYTSGFRQDVRSFSCAANAYDAAWLREGRSIDADGASGSIDFDPDTEETAADIEVWHIDGGQMEGIYRVSP